MSLKRHAEKPRAYSGIASMVILAYTRNIEFDVWTNWTTWLSAALLPQAIPDWLPLQHLSCLQDAVQFLTGGKGGRLLGRL